MERKPKLYEVKNGDLEKVDDMMGKIKHNSAGCTCEGRKCGKDYTCRKRGFQCYPDCGCNAKCKNSI
jgi:hypothetical protein